MVPSAVMGRFAPFARTAPARAIRRDHAVAGEHVDLHGLFESEPSHQAVAAAMATRTAGTVAEIERFEYHRVAPLQHLGIGEPAVRHVGMHP